MKLKSIILMILAAALVLGVNGCNKKPAASNKSAPAEIKKGVAPVADPEIAVIEMETPVYGTIKLELYSNIAPQMVARFKELAREGVYNGTTFHRINENVIQGGDPKSKDDDPANDGSGNSTKPNVPAEFSDLKYESGTLGAARTQDVNTANSQFFITLKRVQDFDTRYTIFGKVIEGMNNVHTISGVQPKEGERPVEAVRIKSVTIQPRN
jgi:peptidylprolyl isomerase